MGPGSLFRDGRLKRNVNGFRAGDELLDISSVFFVGSVGSTQLETIFAAVRLSVTTAVKNLEMASCVVVGIESEKGVRPWIGRMA